MLIVSWWFIVLIVNCLFYDLMKYVNDTTGIWLGIILAITDVALIALLIR